jgi:hypothetical protein
MVKAQRGLLILLALTISVICAVIVSVSMERSRDEGVASRLLNALQHGQNEPSIKEELRQLIERGNLSPETGGEALKQFVSQHLIRRDSYLAGQEVIAKLVVDRPPHFRSYAIRASAKAMAGSEYLGGVDYEEYNWSSGTLPNYEFYRAVKQSGAVASTKSPGEYEGNIVITYRLYRIPSRRIAWPTYKPFPRNLVPALRPRMPGKIPTYQCVVEVPVHLRVAADPDIKLLSSPELDAAVKRVFDGALHSGPMMLRPGPGGPPPPVFVRAKPYEKRSPNPGLTPTEIAGYSYVQVTNAPVSLALKAAFRDQSGIEHKSSVFHLVIEKGTGGAEFLRSASDVFGGLPVGHYRGELVLHPDKEAVYESVRIREIWGGTVSLPIEFDVIPRLAK